MMAPEGRRQGLDESRDRRGSTVAGDFARLRWLGVVLPVVFVIGLEVVRVTFVDRDPGQMPGHLTLAMATIVGVVVFASLMFWLIERAQRQVLRQNRELTAVNAVSTAVQGELGVDVIIDAALSSVIDSTGATEASVTIFAPDGRAEGEGGLERRLVASGHRPPAPDMVSDIPHLIDIPLSTGTSVVGRMRLHMAAGAAEPDLLTSATLQNIGHQLACSVQIGQLVADLNRRKKEGHGLYDILLRISNQDALGDTLAALVGHARALVDGDDAVICLNPTTARSVQLDDSVAAMATLADGGVCISPDADRFRDLTDRPVACPVRAASDTTASAEIAIPSRDGILGELWVGRSADVPYTDRDRRFLMTLAGLASIAITSARMRENERQGAIVAERERIAREMHDSLAQILGVTHLRLRALGGWPEVGEAPRVATELEDLAELTEEAYRDVREAILGLRESTRVDRGLVESLRAYLEKYSHQSGVRATLESTIDGEPALQPRTEVQLIRVIQEALTNVRKHSGASSAVVRLSERDDSVRIVVEDDGRGFDLTGTLFGRDGYGLHTMRERMELIGGTLTIESTPGSGTRVIATISGGTLSAPPSGRSPALAARASDPGEAAAGAPANP
jgi:signal transduction histidine kinase